MKEKFVKLLAEGLKEEELDEGKPKKAIDPDAPVKEKGKRGRPKKDASDNEDDDKSDKEGVRTVTLTAKIKIDGEKKEETKVLKDIDTKDIDDEISKWEKALHKKFNFDADITISKKIGDYDVDDELDTNRPAIDTDGDDY
jgi:ribosomal protein L9